MTITYKSTTDFYDGIAELVKRGLTFESDFTTMTIKLTGGY